MCNLLSFYTNFNDIKISMNFDERNIGVLDMSEVY